MTIRERVTHQIIHGKWDDMMAVEERWNVIEAEIGGFAKKRRSRPAAGRDGSNTYIWEREYDTLAQMEAAYESYATYKGNEDTEDLLAQTNACIAERRTDIYIALS